MKYFPLHIHLQNIGTPAASSGPWAAYEFHILKSARNKYQFDEALFSSSGNVIIPNFHAARVFAQKMNAHRDLKQFPDRAVKAGQINAMGLIDEINHYLLRLYEETVNPGVFSRAISSAEKELTKPALQKTLLKFTEEVPPLEVHRGSIAPGKYLGQITAHKPNTEISLEELLLLYIANSNPALNSYRELFDDDVLKQESEYSQLILGAEQFFRTEKPFGPDNQFIFDLLRAPILASPDSLEGQLAFMKQRWGLMLSKIFLERMLSAEDLIKEDTKIVFHGAGPAPAVVPTYPRGESRDSSGNFLPDIERFTQDIDWMPRVVLLAKNAYVWLDQLSKKYQRPVTRLDHIPDEELDTFARWHFTGLWLIGIWERSSASRRIKQMTGNPEAVSSAYSLYDYTIAYDLGGEDAFNNLKDRAWRRGIRLAGDMVPNHMGLYSKWVIEHPEFFIQSSNSPFPNYRFTGPDLSEDSSVQIRIEDGYWSKTDAAVVFQHIDNRNGNISYFYHGNDGTNMPWNDTAQLNYLKAEVREAVMQTIFHVARKCSIIRFDAAMTLTKKHFQRLWFPRPGTGGDIPSRADHALANEAFDAVFPNEFWREVVDRINAEMPNTLLLAEAFWLLEGYFVRTLGMHRVYNSAFMHMMMKEENAKYREAIKNTLHYNPEILKRYVNFMSNPDEQTAIAQFGKDDKYFGVALLMVTLPGLPMFAHGQIDGYTEKYGMEYKRAYYDEWPDDHLVRRHEREIFPLMNKRHLFSQVENFELYDFVNTNGGVNENVFVYSNRNGDERALVCFHNKFEECKGWVKHSVGKTLSAGEEGNIRSQSLGQALGIHPRENAYYILKEHVSGLQFIRSAQELYHDGMYFELRAFQYIIIHEFSEVFDHTGEYGRLARHLHGRGVHNMNEAMADMLLQPVYHAVSEFLSVKHTQDFQQFLQLSDETVSKKNIPAGIINSFRQVTGEINQVLQLTIDQDSAVRNFEEDLKAFHSIVHVYDKHKADKNIPSDPESLLFILFIQRLGIMFRDVHEMHPLHTSNKSMTLAGVTSSLWKHSRISQPQLPDAVFAWDFSLPEGSVRDQTHFLLEKITDMTLIPEVQEFIQAHKYREVLYFNKERLENLLKWIRIFSLKKAIENKKVSGDDFSSYYQVVLEAAEQAQKSAAEAHYQLIKFQHGLRADQTIAG